MTYNGGPKNDVFLSVSVHSNRKSITVYKKTKSRINKKVKRQKKTNKIH